MNAYPPNAGGVPQQYPPGANMPGGAGYPGVPGVPGLPPGSMPGAPGVPGLPQGMPGMPGMPMMSGADPHMQMLQQQSYIAQQQQLAAMSGHGAGQQTQTPRPPQQRKKNKNRAQAPTLPRNVPQPTTEHYQKNAATAPGAPNAAGAAPEIEPWADALDELDPRELALSRFRARNEVMAEIFGPERVQTIPTKDDDAWAGFGPNGETLEAKVVALESVNAELEAKFEADIEAFRKRLEDADAGKAASQVVAS